MYMHCALDELALRLQTTSAVSCKGSPKESREGNVVFPSPLLRGTERIVFKFLLPMRGFLSRN